MGKNNRHGHKRAPNKAPAYKPPYSDDVLNMAVEGLNLSTETLEILEKGGIRTVGDILSRRKNEMYKVQNFNKKKLFEVVNAISPLGVDFRPDEPREGGQNAERVKGSSDSRREGEPERKADRSERRDEKGRDKSRIESGKPGDRPRQEANAQGRREEKREERREDKQSRRDRDRDHGRENESGKNNRNGKKDKQDNSVDFSKIFPREKLVHSPRIEMKKDRFVKFQRAGKWGFKDKKGTEVIPPIYTEALNFKEDMAAVEMNGLFGYIDRENTLVIPYKYDTAGSFSEGWANVSVGEKCGYVDKTGRETVPFIYDAATPFTGEGYGRVKKDGRWGNITKDGEVSWQ